MRNGAAMSAIAAVVPIKALWAAKSRLGEALGADERATLTLWMLERVVRAVQHSDVVGRIAVVSPDTVALDHAASLGAVTLHQEGGKLNQGLELGRVWACG